MERMGDPKYEGQFSDYLYKEIDRQKAMDKWDWIKEAIGCKVDNISLKETVRSICNIVISQEERINKLENSLPINS